MLFTVECAGEEHRPENDFREWDHLLVVGQGGIYVLGDSRTRFLWSCTIDQIKMLENNSSEYSGVI